MKRTTVVLTIIVLMGSLFAAAVPIVLAKDGSGDDDDDADDRSGGGRGDGDRDRRGSRDNDRDARGDPGRTRPPGHFRDMNGSLDGRFVSFQFNQSSCEVRNYRVYDVTFFESIRLPVPCKIDGDLRSPGRASRLELKGEDAELRIHDNPTGLIRFEADDGDQLEFRLATGVTVSNTTNRSVDLAAGNLSARLFLTGEGDDDGNASLTLDGARIAVMNAKGNFLVHPARGDSPEREKVRTAIHQGKFGGQIDVLIENGTVSHEVLAFDDVIIKVSRKNDSAFRFVVDANLTEGRVFVVNFAPGAFQAEKVGVRYYDVDDAGIATEVAILQSSNLSDVLDIQPGEGPEYWVVKDDEGRHVLVAVPSFSVHVFEVQSLSAVVTPIIVYGVVVGVAFVAAAATGMLIGRKRPL